MLSPEKAKSQTLTLCWNGAVGDVRTREGDRCVLVIVRRFFSTIRLWRFVTFTLIHHVLNELAMETVSRILMALLLNITHRL